MNNRPTPETKWYVTEYPEECSFAITDGNEILVTIIGGNTIGDQCDLASRIAKLPDLERERDEAIDKYQSLQKTFEEWQLKFLSEQAELLHIKDVERDKLFDEAYQIRIERDELQDALEHAQMTIGSIVSPSDKATLELIKVTKERDEAREEIRDWKRLHDAAERGVDLTIAEGTISDLLKQRNEAREKYDTLAVENMLTINKLCKERDEARLEAAMWALQRDEAREAAAKWEAVALREASINGARICAKKGAK